MRNKVFKMNFVMINDDKYTLLLLPDIMEK